MNGTKRDKVRFSRSAATEAASLLLAVLALVVPAWAASSTGGGADGASLEEEALRHIEDGSPREAIDLLRGEADTEARALLLARAYLDDGNDFWAMRTLQELAQTSEGCAPDLWLAFVLLRQGALEEGRDVLEITTCREGSPLAVRKHLLEALIASTAGETAEARAALRKAERGERAYPEDLRALRALRPSIEESYVVPISGRLELHSGWTSNAMAGSPTDPAAAGGPPASPLAHISGSTRVIIPAEWRPRPALEVELRGLGIGAERGRDLSYLQLSARPAVLFGDRASALLGYRLETLGVLGGDQFGDGPIWFYEAHRGELDIELAPWLTLFGGAGHRKFREGRRSRVEMDLGLGGAHRPTPSLSLVGAVIVRHHKAARDFYDLFGATALAQATWLLPRGLSARFSLLGSFDDYPSSNDFFAAGVARRDLLSKLTAGLWLPRTPSGLRAGLTYELSGRSSTAPDYEYIDHRLLLRVQLSFSFDPRGPRADLPVGHVPLSWGLEEEDGALEETIQDLLRQDEAVRAGSSCVE